MTLFLLSFFSTYLFMHVVVFLGLRPLFHDRALPALALSAVMLLMVLAPILVRLLENAGKETTARLLAMAGYSWMGLLFLAFVAFVLLALWNLTISAVGRLWPAVAGWQATGPLPAATVLILVLATGLYGVFEARALQLERVRIASAKLPAGTPTLRLVQISDLHLGLIHRRQTLAGLVARIEELRPDLVVATGDIVDAQINHLDGLAELFSKIDPPLGKFAVTGNHEFYAGLDQSLDFVRHSGFTVLRGQRIEVGDWLTIVGVDDPTARTRSPEEELLANADPRRFTILLKHRPEVAASSLGRFDLQLSGHAHRGQIFPFNLLTALAYPLQDGYHRLAGGSVIYASRGTGTWGPPMRVLSPPEITLIEIVPQAPADHLEEKRSNPGAS